MTGPRRLDELSSQSLLLFAIYLCFRLSSTCVLNLLRCMHLNPVYQYDNDKDTMPIYPMVLPCILLGIFIHGNFNRNAMYDAIWQISTNIETLAMLPQLMLLSKTGGKVDAT